jgi:cyclic pyranopterin phosphate synthase
MSFENLKTLIDFIQDQDVAELCFSGGEPFLNRDLVRMIRYADDNTASDIGCATNLSLITDTQIQELSSTRVKFNIQFPFASDADFRDSTGSGNYMKVVETIKKVQDSGINIGLNSVIQSLDMSKLVQVLEFALENELPLKLLPQIGLAGSDRFKEKIYPLLQEKTVERIDKGTGAIRYTLEKGNHRITVLYIDSPCFTKDIERCRKYGEIRVLPDMTLQSCILKGGTSSLALERGKEFVLSQFRALWKDFNHC